MAEELQLLLQHFGIFLPGGGKSQAGGCPAIKQQARALSRNVLQHSLIVLPIVQLHRPDFHRSSRHRSGIVFPHHSQRQNAALVARLDETLARLCRTPRDGRGFLQGQSFSIQDFVNIPAALAQLHRLFAACLSLRGRPADQVRHFAVPPVGFSSAPDLNRRGHPSLLIAAGN